MTALINCMSFSFWVSHRSDGAAVQQAAVGERVRDECGLCAGSQPAWPFCTSVTCFKWWIILCDENGFPLGLTRVIKSILTYWQCEIISGMSADLLMVAWRQKEGGCTDCGMISTELCFDLRGHKKVFNPSLQFVKNEILCFYFCNIILPDPGRL